MDDDEAGGVLLEAGWHLAVHRSDTPALLGGRGCTLRIEVTGPDLEGCARLFDAATDYLRDPLGPAHVELRTAVAPTASAPAGAALEDHSA